MQRNISLCRAPCCLAALHPSDASVQLELNETVFTVSGRFSVRNELRLTNETENILRYFTLLHYLALQLDDYD